ncbi:MAG: hypothetical protein KDD70_19340, partial [Bdellovibrionales bacterium]|nr:hypothetical protein [Bdellovibrionales bacterium]
MNLDFVYTPSFDADRFIDGRRISFFNPLAGEITGRGQPLQVDRRQSWFRDDEISARLYRRFGSVEAALYGYRGYWKSPGGFDIQSGQATFPRLAVYGGSLRGPLLSGIANLEVGYYDSRDDRSGDNPLVRNSEFRALAGYERELMSNFTIGMKYYVEQLLDYGDFRRA